MNESSAEIEGTTDTLLPSLQQRADRLLGQLRAYQACLQAQSKQRLVEIRTFKRGVESEVKTLRSILSRTTHTEELLLDDVEREELQSKQLHALRSSNLSFYEAVWAIVLQSRNIVALGKRVYCSPEALTRKSPASTSTRNDVHVSTRSKADRKGAVVDIVAQDGLEWIKVSTVTEKRLLFDIAKEGWENYADQSSDEDYESQEDNDVPGKDKDQPIELELVKTARTICAASRSHRVHFKHPRVKFVLPKIQEGHFDDVDAVIADIRAAGVEVICANDLLNGGPASDLLTTPFQSLNLHSETRDMTYLLPSLSMFSPPPTPVLNIDCTILLALISDISHIFEAKLPPYPPNASGIYHKTIKLQISTESTSPLLPTEIYPVIRGKHLLCTARAVQRMREIVQTMGTETERQRANIILAENNRKTDTPEQLCLALRDLSCHDVPTDLQLPLQIVEDEFTRTSNCSSNGNNTAPAPSVSIPQTAPTLSPFEQTILHQIPQKMNLSQINQSVFLYGWRGGMVTITSNKVIATGLVRCINDVLDEEELKSQQAMAAAQQASVVAAAAGDAPNNIETVGNVNIDAADETFVGPKIYICETARSLIGKEKQGGGGGGKKK